MDKQTIVKHLITPQAAQKKTGQSFAPSNIALTKYWGKRDEQINLPVTGSLSISLGSYGTQTEIEESSEPQDSFILNNQAVSRDTEFFKRAAAYLDLFRPRPSQYYRIKSNSNIPIAAGLASSASGFASIIVALDDLYGWQLSKEKLSILARLGSGSAARSLWHGFVEWHEGRDPEGMDSFATPLKTQWPEFRIALLIFETAEKKISSRKAMKQTVETSLFYPQWSNIVAHDLQVQKKAIAEKDFKTLGECAEANAIAMHATMHTARPSISYSSLETYAAIEKIRHLRANQCAVYFTQDAGPNLKLLYESSTSDDIKEIFPSCIEIAPFSW